MTEASPLSTTQATARPLPQRRAAMIIATALFVVLGLLWITFALINGGRYVKTEDAYVDAPSVGVTSLLPAPVLSVNVTDTQSVKQGDVLVVLDDTDLKLAHTQANAQLQMALRRVGTYYDNNTALRAQADLARSNIEAANSAIAQLKALPSDATTAAKLQQAQTALVAAKAQAAVVNGQASANSELTRRVDLNDHPEVVAAQAQLQQSENALSRTLIRAKVSGIIARREVDVGQLALPGAPLMTIIATDQAYVNANFKEGQLKNVRRGQDVTLTSDLYGTGVVFHGHVAGISAGTGSTLALIPAQNATGNWIKVVQRLPVRITLDEAETNAHPLRVGMTMTARIDTRTH